MRNAFSEELTVLAGKDKRIVLLSGDIGNRLFDRYKELYPDRFYNCGVAEGNMVSLAAGLALCGMRPVTYTITPFNTARCYEQIRVDVAFHRLPVIIVGVGSGLSYAELGPTHHSFDDIALMRVLPDMAILCPSDSLEVKAALRAALNYNGPLYIRLGKKGEPVIHREVPDLVIGKAIIIKPGMEVSILSTGNMLPVAMDVAEDLEKRSISTEVVSFHTVKPLDVDLLKHCFSNRRIVVSLEEHSIHGGLGSAIAEWMAMTQNKGAFLSIGIADSFFKKAGKQVFARSYYGIDKEGIIKRILNLI